MKIILSHDVDYISFSEHLRNLTVQKYVIRSFVELGCGYIRPQEFLLRYRFILENKFNNLDELTAFDSGNCLPATYFIAVSNGRDGLNYSAQAAAKWIEKVKEKGFDVGVHGINFRDFEEMKKEKERFETIYKGAAAGVRIHYLRTVGETYGLLQQAGYRYDSSEFDLSRNPYKIGNMWEFPIHLMDSFLINGGRPWQSITLTQARQRSEALIAEALNKKITHFNILFHDNHFSDAFLTWKNWYIWLIEYFKQNSFTFVSYKQAIQELEQTASSK